MHTSFTILFIAARSGNLTGVKNALLLGANINAQTTDGKYQTALMLGLKLQPTQHILNQ